MIKTRVKQQVLQDMQDQFDEWKDVQLKNMSISRCLGLTNITYKVSSKQSNIHPQKVIYRQFCPNECLQQFFKREDEELVFNHLSSIRQGPQNLAHNGQIYRIEEFIEGTHPDPQQMISRDFKLALMKKMAKVKETQIDGIDKQNSIIQRYLNNTTIMENYKLQVDSSELSENQKVSLKQMVDPSQIQWLQSLNTSDTCNLVFSHNDLNSNNIFMQNKPNLELVLIDFEFSGYNKEGYDFASYLNESMFDYNVSDYPFYSYLPENYCSDKSLNEMITYYIYYRYYNQNIPNEFLHNFQDFQQYLSSQDYYQQFQQKINQLLFSIEVSLLVSNHYWTIETILMSSNKDIQFDFFHYAIQRQALFFNFKNQFIENHSNLL